MAVNRLYETLYLLDANKASADPTAAHDYLHGLLEKYGAEILVSRSWDESRKLTYPIRLQNVTHKKGFYYILYYRMESVRQAEVETDLRISELVIRHLTSAIDPKWEEVVLDSAKNDQATAFAIRGMQDEAAGGDVTPNLDGPVGGLAGGIPSPSGEGDGRRPQREMAEKPE